MRVFCRLRHDGAVDRGDTIYVWGGLPGHIYYSFSAEDVPADRRCQAEQKRLWDETMKGQRL